MKTILICMVLAAGSFGTALSENNMMTRTSTGSSDSLLASSRQLLDWGQGFFIASEMISSQQIELGLGYSFGLGGHIPLRRPYTGGVRGGRLGIGIGVKYVADELIYDTDASLFYRSNALGPYVQLNYGSPILRDLVSVSTHLKVMYLSRLPDTNKSLAENDWGLGIGGSIGFWLYENMSVDLGMTFEGTFSEPLSEVVRYYNRPLLQRKLRPQFGITVFF